MAIKLTMTNGVVRQFPIETQCVCVAIDAAKNKWKHCPVNQVQVGDKMTHYDEPGEPLEVALVEQL